jgi:hypothetical protein
MTVPALPIPGGYILLARKLLESELMNKPPHYLKLWVWMLLKAFWRDGDKFKRGQFLTTISEMQDVGIHRVGNMTRGRFTEDEVRSAYGYLANTGAIATAKATRGIIITICNYELYQNPKSYEPHTEPHGETAPNPTLKIKEGIKKEKPLPAKKQPVDFRLFSDWFVYAFEIAQGQPYIFEGAKDAKLLSSMLKAISCKELVAKACHFLTDQDRFPKTKAPSISFLKSKINDYPPHINGKAEEYRLLGIIPPEGVTLEEWRPWQN